MKGVLLQTIVDITEEYNVFVNSEELFGTTEYVTLYTRCRINRCRYNRVRLRCIELHTYIGFSETSIYVLHCV
jgi:hypothetical protein